VKKINITIERLSPKGRIILWVNGEQERTYSVHGMLKAKADAELIESVLGNMGWSVTVEGDT